MADAVIHSSLWTGSLTAVSCCTGISILAGVARGPSVSRREREHQPGQRPTHHTDCSCRCHGPHVTSPALPTGTAQVMWSAMLARLWRQFIWQSKGACCSLAHELWQSVHVLDLTAKPPCTAAGADRPLPRRQGRDAGRRAVLRACHLASPPSPGGSTFTIRPQLCCQPC